MTAYVGKKTYVSAERIGGGGEGDIFSIRGDPDHVLKVFNREHRAGREQKIKAMIDHPVSEKVDQFITWPKDIIYENNQFVGYVMRRINTSENLCVFYEYGSASKFPNASTRDKIVLAMNLCVVLDYIHKAGHVVGDFNPNNIAVDVGSYHPTFVDTDSYHISNGKYRCSVGMSHYIPKEIAKKLRGSSLEAIDLPTFTENSDNFALAVHIFQLLMNGCHPYSGSVSVVGSSIANPPPNVNILSDVVPFINPSPGIDIPKYAPKFDSLPKEIQTMFKEAFLGKEDERPSALDWYSSLRNYYGNMRQCSEKPWHYYYNMLSECPFCDADQRYSAGARMSSSYMSGNLSKSNSLNQTGSSSISSQNNYDFKFYNIETDANRQFSPLSVLCNYADEEVCWALNELGLMYNTGSIQNQSISVSKDYSKALEYYERSADKKNKYAVNQLGLMYYYGLGTTVDYDKSYELFKKASNAGLPEAYCNQAMMYIKGNYVYKDEKTARSLYSKASYFGCPIAHYNLGLMYEHGIGVKQNYETAYSCYLESIRDFKEAELAIKRIAPYI